MRTGGSKYAEMNWYERYIHLGVNITGYDVILNQSAHRILYIHLCNFTNNEYSIPLSFDALHNVKMEWLKYNY